MEDSCGKFCVMRMTGLEKDRPRVQVMKVHERSIGGATCRKSRHVARGLTRERQSNEPAKATQERLAALFRQAVAVALWNTGRRLGVAVP
jgi:hypothetical protein